MSIVNKSDVKNHLSAHHHKGIHLCRPVSEPAATVASEAESAPSDPGTESSVEENRAQPASGKSKSSMPVVDSSSEDGSKPGASKNAQA